MAKTEEELDREVEKDLDRRSADPMQVWSDPRVNEAFKDGRGPDDISVLRCPACLAYSYYNDGSHFTCHRCDAGYTCITEDEEPPVDRPYIILDEVLNMDDVISADLEELGP